MDDAELESIPEIELHLETEVETDSAETDQLDGEVDPLEEKPDDSDSKNFIFSLNFHPFICKSFSCKLL